MPLAQDILEWPGDWVAAQMGWAAGPSAPGTPKAALPPFPGWQGVWISNQTGTWNGVLSTGATGPQGTQVHCVSQQLIMIAHVWVRACTPTLQPWRKGRWCFMQTRRDQQPAVACPNTKG